MKNQGWRIVIAEDAASLGYSSGNISIKTACGARNIPIAQISTLIINSYRISLSACLVSELSKNGVKLIFCDEKKNPCCELTPYSNNWQSSGRLFSQLEWSREEKDVMWQKIVKSKIICQYKLLKHLGISGAERLLEYSDAVEPADNTNREGQAARIYFELLFGRGFLRHSCDRINSALNYGYTVLLSMINRLVAAYGYNSCLGIKHCSQSNPHNLSCDLIEVFRPFVDKTVYKNQQAELTSEYKKELIGVLCGDIFYDKKKTDMQTAAELYICDVLKNMTNINYTMRDIDFEQTSRHIVDI